MITEHLTIRTAAELIAFAVAAGMRIIIDNAPVPFIPCVYKPKDGAAVVMAHTSLFA